MSSPEEKPLATIQSSLTEDTTVVLNDMSSGLEALGDICRMYIHEANSALDRLADEIKQLRAQHATDRSKIEALEKNTPQMESNHVAALKLIDERDKKIEKLKQHQLITANHIQKFLADKDDGIEQPTENYKEVKAAYNANLRVLQQQDRELTLLKKKLGERDIQSEVEKLALEQDNSALKIAVDFYKNDADSKTGTEGSDTTHDSAPKTSASFTNKTPADSLDESATDTMWRETYYLTVGKDAVDGLKEHMNDFWLDHRIFNATHDIGEIIEAVKEGEVYGLRRLKGEVDAHFKVCDLCELMGSRKEWRKALNEALDRPLELVTKYLIRKFLASSPEPTDDSNNEERSNTDSTDYDDEEDDYEVEEDDSDDEEEYDDNEEEEDYDDEKSRSSKRQKVAHSPE